VIVVYQTCTLTTGVDAGAGFTGGNGADTFYATAGGSGATLNGYDALAGGAGIDTLSIFDTATAAAITIPAGLALTGIEKIFVATSKTAGSATAPTVFDVSSYGITDLTVSSGDAAGDNVKAAVITNIADTNILGGVTTVGGKDVTISAKGAVNSTTAAGAVAVAQNSTSNSIDVIVGSGTSVSVTQKSPSGSVTIGNNSTDPNPTGAISVTQTSSTGATGTGAIAISGGTDVSVSAKGNAVTVGGSAARNPSGAVSVTQSFKGDAGDIVINGGLGVKVTTSGGGDTGAIVIGTTVPTGRAAVVVNDTNADVANNATYDDVITVRGGTTVNVTTTMSAATITVGNTAALDSAGTALSASSAAQLPTGDVSITNASASNTKSTGAAATGYGTGTVSVTMNGGTSATFIGGVVAVTDAQSTAATGGTGAGAAIGASKLATVSMEGVGTGSTIASDALATLNLTKVATSDDKTITIANNTAGHSLAINLNANGSSSGSGYEPQVTDDKATSIVVSDLGTSSNRIALAGSKLTSITFNNANALTLTAVPTMDTAKDGTITALGAGSLTLPTLSSMTKLTLIDASSRNGSVTATIDGTVTSYKGGSGVDTITLSTGATKSIDGGAGTGDIVKLNAAATTYTPLLSPGVAISSLVSNFETLSLVSGATGSYNASGFTGLRNEGAAAAVTFTNVAVGTPLTLASSNSSGGTTVTLPSGTSTTNAFDLTISGSSTSSTSPRTGSVTLTGAGTGAADGVKTVNITSTGANTSASYPNALTYADGAAGDVTTFNIGGTAAVALTYQPATSSALTTVNVTNTKPTDVTNVYGSATGVTYTGGAGKMTVDTGAGSALGAGGSGLTSANSVVSGAGGVTVSVGIGGAGGAAGSESVNLTASTSVQDSVTVGAASSGAGRRVAVTNFSTSEASTTDKLTFGAGKTAVANVSTATAAANASSTYKVSNGVVTFTSVSNANTALLDLQSIVNASGANKVAAAVIGGSTYVVASDASATLLTSVSVSAAGTASLGAATGIAAGDAITVTIGSTSYLYVVKSADITSGAFNSTGATNLQTAVGLANNTFGISGGNLEYANGTTGALTVGATVVKSAGDALIQLGGLAAVAGFGTTAAENTILVPTSNGVTNVGPASALTNSGTSTAATYDATGYGLVTLDSTTALTKGSSSTTITGLAPSATLTSSSNTTLTDIRVSQSGTSGKNSLTFAESNSSAANTVSKLTLTGDKALTIANTNSDANGLTFTSLVDGGDTNTLATITVTGSGKTTLAAITDTALTTIDASAATGELVLGSGTPLSKVGLTVYGSKVANTISTSGSNAVIYVDHAGTVGHMQTITASGSGSSVTITHSGTQASGTGSYAITANGAGAIVNTSGFTVYGSTAPTVSATGVGSSLTLGPGLSSAIVEATVGQGATVTLLTGSTSGAAYVNVNVAKATADDGSSGAYYYTTIKGTTASTDTVTFPAVTGRTYTYTPHPVNVGSATTLAQALDQAATGSSLTSGDAYVNWFQYGGDTWIVANVAESTSTTGFDSSDMIVKLAGLVDLSGVTTAGAGSGSALAVPVGP